MVCRSCFLSGAFLLFFLTFATGCGDGRGDADPNNPGSNTPTPTPTPSPTPGATTKVAAFSNGQKIYTETENYEISIGYNPDVTSTIYDSATMHVEVLP
jgi:hypothetical protein